MISLGLGLPWMQSAPQAKNLGGKLKKIIVEITWKNATQIILYKLKVLLKPTIRANKYYWPLKRSQCCKIAPLKFEFPSPSPTHLACIHLALTDNSNGFTTDLKIMIHHPLGAHGLQTTYLAELTMIIENCDTSFVCNEGSCQNYYYTWNVMKE